MYITNCRAILIRGWNSNSLNEEGEKERAIQNGDALECSMTLLIRTIVNFTVRGGWVFQFFPHFFFSRKQPRNHSDHFCKSDCYFQFIDENLYFWAAKIQFGAIFSFSIVMKSNYHGFLLSHQQETPILFVEHIVSVNQANVRAYNWLQLFYTSTFEDSAISPLCN